MFEWLFGEDAPVDDTYTAEDFADQADWVTAQQESGQADLQANLGTAFRDSTLGTWNEETGAGIVQEALGQNIVNTVRSGSLGDFLSEARAGLAYAREGADIYQAARSIADPYTVGRSTGPTVTVVPARTTGAGQPGVISAGAAGTWGKSLGLDTSDGLNKAVLYGAAAALAGLALKRALA